MVLEVADDVDDVPMDMPTGMQADEEKEDGGPSSDTPMVPAEAPEPAGPMPPPPTLQDADEVQSLSLSLASVTVGQLTEEQEDILKKALTNPRHDVTHWPNKLAENAKVKYY